MPHSMTGFAAADAVADGRKLVWEIRSVNHRYLDLGFRLPEELRSLEPKLRKLAGDRLSRGKVDCSLKRAGDTPVTSAGEINTDQLHSLRALEGRVLEANPDATRLSVAEILRWPGILQEQTTDPQQLIEPVLAGFEQALVGLCSAREREGDRLAAILRERFDAIESLLDVAAKEMEGHALRHRERLLERISKLDLDVNAERLEQEVALIAQRIDVTEEYDRLRAHLVEVRDVLERQEPVGRRLDFLIQELNREANTLASKVQEESLARVAVDMKVLIEQLREQVQNLE